MRDVAYYAEMKNRLARSANETRSPGLKRELWTAFSKCDVSILKLTRYLKSVRRWVIIVNLLVIITMLSGCQTLKGATGDAGWMLTKLSENIQTESK